VSVTGWSRLEQEPFRRSLKVPPSRTISTRTGVHAAEGPYRAEEVELSERRPVHVCEVELAAAALPGQKAAQAHLPARPDDEVRIGVVGRVQMSPDCIRVDVLRQLVSRHSLFGQRPDKASHRVDELVATAVAERDAEAHTVISLHQAISWESLSAPRRCPAPNSRIPARFAHRLFPSRIRRRGEAAERRARALADDACTSRRRAPGRRHLRTPSVPAPFFSSWDTHPHHVPAPTAGCCRSASSRGGRRSVNPCGEALRVRL
jgi:hypothetical protein